jgi:hypothetical protein
LGYGIRSEEFGCGINADGKVTRLSTLEKTPVIFFFVCYFNDLTVGQTVFCCLMKVSRVRGQAKKGNQTSRGIVGKTIFVLRRDKGLGED